MEEGADNGDILSQKKVLISNTDDAKSLYDKLSNAALFQIEELYAQLKTNTFERTKQDHSKANLWRKRGKNDGGIDFRMSSESIYNLIRGLAKPYVGAHIEIGNMEIKVWKSQIGEKYNENIEPGKIINIVEDKILVKTGNGTIWLLNHDFKELPKINEYI